MGLGLISVWNSYRTRIRLFLNINQPMVLNAANEFPPYSSSLCQYAMTWLKINQRDWYVLPTAFKEENEERFRSALQGRNKSFGLSSQWTAMFLQADGWRQKIIWELIVCLPSGVWWLANWRAAAKTAMEAASKKNNQKKQHSPPSALIKQKTNGGSRSQSGMGLSSPGPRH